LETVPLLLRTDRLAGKRYGPNARWSVGEVARIGEPFGVTIDLDALLSR
jgi:hypothetical protein